MYKLDDVCKLITDGSHFSPEDELEGYPMLSVKDMSDDDFNFSNCKRVGEESFKKLLANGCKPLVNDVVVAKDGSFLKTAFVIKEDRDIALLSSIAILRPDINVVVPEYLSYFLKSNEVYRTVSLNYISGTALKRIILKGIKQIPISLPNLQVQEYRVKLLNRLRIIINKRKRQLVCFDELIKARFVEMFGNPELNEKGWQTCRLGDKCTVINGRAYKADELLDSGKYRVLRVGNFFTNDSWYYSDLELEDDKYCEDGDLLFAWSASFGPRIWHGEKVIYHYHIWKLVGYKNCFNKDFFVELLNYNCDVMKRGTHGSTMLHFTKSQMEDQRLILPPIEMQIQFAEFVKQVDKSKFINVA